MDIKTQMIQEYLTHNGGFRKFADKNGISRTIICKWVMIHQAIHNLPLTEMQQKDSVYSREQFKKIIKHRRAANCRSTTAKNSRFKKATGMRKAEG